MEPQPALKNIVYGSIIAGGDVHIGDKIYVVEQAFQHSILFLQLSRDPATDGYHALLSVKSDHLPDGLSLFHEKIPLAVSPDLFRQAEQFEESRLRGHALTRRDGVAGGGSPQQQEDRLSAWLFETFFPGDVGAVCRDFVHLLERRKIEDLHLVIASTDDAVRNLPWEMVIPHLFPPLLGQVRQHLANSRFALARSTETSLAGFNLSGPLLTHAPLKLLFVTALPENLNEQGKLLELEDEARKLIEAVGGLEATGDNRPKMVIEFLDCASLKEIDEALTGRHHDIVHISGHGAFRDGRGLLFLEDEHGDVQEVDGQTLGAMLRRHAGLRLLLLSACETAVAGQGGMAEQLAATGIPAVLAMRYAVTDEGARQFTTAFYAQLADGQPLAGAMEAGREALWQAVQQRRQDAPQLAHAAEWFTPVLYLNQHLGALVKKQPYDEDLLRRFYPRTALSRGEHTRLIGQGFIGRKRYLIQLRKAFREGRAVCLHGMGGLGKTTLAEAFADNYCRRFNGTDLLNFRNENVAQLDEKTVLDRVFRHWKSAVKPTDFQTEEVREALEHPDLTPIQKLDHLLANCIGPRKLILLFDNFEDVQQEEGGGMSRHIARDGLRLFYQHLLAQAHRCPGLRLLFTTRYAVADFEPQWIDHLPLDKMTYAEQYRYLNYSDSLRRIPATQREAVWRRLDGHPRAMSFLEALLRHDPAFDWAGLDASIGRVEQQVFADLLLKELYARLPTDAERRLFAQAAVFFSRSPVTALATATGLAEAALRTQLAALRSWSLCFYEEKEDRFEVHGLNRTWALAAGLLGEEERKGVARKVGAYFRDQPGWDDEELAIGYFEVGEDWEEFAKASFRLQGFCERMGFNERVVALNKAVWEQDVAIKTKSVALNNLGLIFHKTGNYGQALGHFEPSLKLFQEIRDREGEGATLNNIGLIHLAKGDYDTALGYLQQSLKIRRQIGDREGEGATLNNIGQFYHARGDYDTALNYWLQSLEIMQDMGDQHGQGRVLNNIGHVYSAKGDYNQALDYLEQSLKISQGIGDRQGEGITLNNFAFFMHAKGDYDQALSYLQQSLRIQQDIGDRQGEGLMLNNIGQNYSEKGDYDQALGYLQRSLKIQQEIGDRQGEGMTLNNLANLAYFKNDHDQALGYLQQSLQIRQDIGDIYGVANTLTNMGVMLFEQERPEEALPMLLSAYRILEEIGSPDIQHSTNYLNKIFEKIGQPRFQAIVAQLNAEQ